MKWVLAAKESQEQEIMAVAAQIVVGGRRLGAREKQHGQGFGEPGTIDLTVVVVSPFSCRLSSALEICSQSPIKEAQHFRVSYSAQNPVFYYTV
jgi:hypothetical protein